VALVLVHRFIPESPIKTPSRVDYLGASLLSGGLIAMLVALTEGEHWGWTSQRILGLAAAAVVLLFAWGVAELHVDEPMVDMRMLARREILFTNITALISGFAMFGTFVLVPNFVEMPHGLSASLQHAVHYGFDASATKAGLYLLPSSFALLFAGPLAGLIGRKVGFKWPLAAGMLLVSISAGSLTEWHDKPWQILASMPVLGVGVGFAFAAMATLITEAVRPTETGVATGMNTVMRTVGGVIGGQVGAALLAAHTIRGTNVPSVDGFKIAFGIAAVVALIGACVAVFITPPRLRRRERLVVATTEATD
jgi:MFS family permease